jgi:hypothetical protein
LLNLARGQHSRRSSICYLRQWQCRNGSFTLPGARAHRVLAAFPPRHSCAAVTLSGYSGFQLDQTNAFLRRFLQIHSFTAQYLCRHCTLTGLTTSANCGGVGDIGCRAVAIMSAKSFLRTCALWPDCVSTDDCTTGDLMGVVFVGEPASEVGELASFGGEYVIGFHLSRSRRAVMRLSTALFRCAMCAFTVDQLMLNDAPLNCRCKWPVRGH